MILAVDIGNSNICIGGLDGMKVLFTARMVTRPRSARADGYAKPNERIWVDLSGK